MRVHLGGRLSRVRTGLGYDGRHVVGIRRSDISVLAGLCYCLPAWKPNMTFVTASLGAPDAVLARFREALDAAFGDRIERVILYGSRARGDARPDSDYDVA